MARGMYCGAKISEDKQTIMARLLLQMGLRYMKTNKQLWLEVCNVGLRYLKTNKQLWLEVCTVGLRYLKTNKQLWLEVCNVYNVIL